MWQKYLNTLRRTLSENLHKPPWGGKLPPSPSFDACFNKGQKRLKTNAAKLFVTPIIREKNDGIFSGVLTVFNLSYRFQYVEILR